MNGQGGKTLFVVFKLFWESLIWQAQTLNVCMVYLPIWMVNFMVNVGKYIIHWVSGKGLLISGWKHSNYQTFETIKPTINSGSILFPTKWVFPKIMVPPNHPFVHRVFHYFHHPFGDTTIFGSTPKYVLIISYYSSAFKFPTSICTPNTSQILGINRLQKGLRIGFQISARTSLETEF